MIAKYLSILLVGAVKPKFSMGLSPRFRCHVAAPLEPLIWTCLYFQRMTLAPVLDDYCVASLSPETTLSMSWASRLSLDATVSFRFLRRSSASIDSFPRLRRSLVTIASCHLLRRMTETIASFHPLIRASVDSNHHHRSTMGLYALGWPSVCHTLVGVDWSRFSKD